MKELSIAEKAKRYNKAIGKAAALYKASEPMSGCNVIIETLFPELAESEDERIRRQTLKVLNYYKDEEKSEGRMPTEIEECIAWLEKQGEKKSNPVLDIEIPFGAKDSELQEASYYIPEGFHAEIEGNRVVIKRGEQKPAWSEEDEEILDGIIVDVEVLKEQDRTKDGKTAYQKEIDWLKSLKPKSKQEWSEEDEDKFNQICSCVEAAPSDVCYYSSETLENWLKSLRPQNRWKPSGEQIMAIDTAINVLGKGTLNGKQLIELYQDLKKLKGEEI